MTIKTRKTSLLLSCQKAPSPLGAGIDGGALRNSIAQNKACFLKLLVKKGYFVGPL